MKVVNHIPPTFVEARVASCVGARVGDHIAAHVGC